jgi:class 3 adenylate cyclase
MLTPQGFKFHFHWIDEQDLGNGTTLIIGETRITIPLLDRTMIFNPVRISAVFQKKQKSYKLVHWHVSFPDSSGTDEIFPGSAQPIRYEDVTVVFTDLVNFTQVSSQLSPNKRVTELNSLFSRFDALSLDFGLDKIKTIGDSYMVASGLCQKHQNHARQAVEWARAVLNFLEERNKTATHKWDIRIGVHSGVVVGGVIGTDKLSFDLWGDTVNVANRLERFSAANRINISAETHQLIKDAYEFEYRGTCDVKGKGPLVMYYVV